MPAQTEVCGLESQTAEFECIKKRYMMSGLHRLGIVMCSLSLLGAGLTAPPAFGQETARVRMGTPAEPARRTRTPIPAWAQDARWYQIAVPRYSNGNPANDPPGTLPWTTRWPTQAAPADGSALDDTQYGGDLQGLRKRLPYLQDLAVNTLWLGSLFHALPKRNGKVVDLRHIDDSLGVKDSLTRITGETADPKTWRFSDSDRAFLEFLKEAHHRGFRVVVEVDLSEARRALEPGTDTEEQLLAMARRWMDPNGDGLPSDGVDGWVLRQPDKMEHEFWKRWRTHTKKLNPDIVLVGDVTSDPASWLKGDEFDVAINYAAARAIQRFFRAGDEDYTLKRFFADLAAINSRHALSARLAAPTPLSSSRMGRMLSALSEVTASPAGGSTPSIAILNNQALARWRLAIVFQHFYVGAPVIYYGDEVGMHGGKGPLSRAPMWWSDLSELGTKDGSYPYAVAPLVRWLHVRRDIDKPLRLGDVRPILLDETHRIMAFARSLPGEELILVMNYGKTKQMVMLPAGKPGQLVGVLSPAIQPSPRSRRSFKPWAGPPNRIPPRRMGGSRQILNAEGLARLWVAPMSIRVVLARDEQR